MGMTTILIPYCHQLWHFYLIVCIFGLGAGAWNNASNVWLIELEQKNISPLLQLSGFMYGIGNVITPLIERPYLTGESHVHYNETFAFNSTTELKHMIDNNERRSKLMTPFLVIGVIGIIGCYDNKEFDF